jgi:hypothetical protein
MVLALAMAHASVEQRLEYAAWHGPDIVGRMAT